MHNGSSLPMSTKRSRSIQDVVGHPRFPAVLRRNARRPRSGARRRLSAQKPSIPVCLRPRSKPLARSRAARRSRPTRLPSMPRPWSGVSLSSSCFRRCAVCLGALSGRGAVSCCPDPRRLGTLDGQAAQPCPGGRGRRSDLLGVVWVYLSIEDGSEAREGQEQLQVMGISGTEV